jgi:hypothetical protein
VGLAPTQELVSRVGMIGAGLNTAALISFAVIWRRQKRCGPAVAGSSTLGGQRMDWYCCGHGGDRTLANWAFRV